jgi:hypothetical protein
MIAPGILLALALQAPQAPYWQQRLEYNITATLDEQGGTLAGSETIVYHNNSPDTLRTFALHLYLNAFRPGSRWADADSVEHRRRFNDLKDPDFGYNRVRDVTIDGQSVAATYPFAPDSTVARFPLPRAIAPGESFTVSMRWEARPSTVPRRQGRRGRRFDFAQWYPRVVAYDKYGWEEHPLFPAGEFYGDFGDFTVLLDVPEDQVVGATGVPLCGDPGWERANHTPARAIEYQRDFYANAPSCGPQSGVAPAAAPGRKRILWYARDVHHFAMSMSPSYLYEGGRFGSVAVHVLYRPGDETSWGAGVAVKNTETALDWLDGLFGRFPWPQLTNVHRIEGGGTEFPMMVHDGSADLGLILHEVGHNYLMGILANNEWREGFLDEGFTSFQTTWYAEAHRERPDVGASEPTDVSATERQILLSDLDGWSEPTSLVSEHYRDFRTYNAMIYSRGELFYHRLRTIVGDSTMRAILRTYYQRWKLKHVDEAAFRAVAEEVSGRDLSTFFGQWLHSTVLYDYAVGRVKTQGRKDARTQGGEGARAEGWTTRVEVVRKSPGMFPVDVLVRSATDSAMIRAEGSAERELVELTTRGRPREVMLDPRVRFPDWNMLNNRKRRGPFGFRRAPRHEIYLDQLFSQRTRRDRLTVGLIPTVWYNDEGGLTIGGRARSDYLSRFDQNIFSYSVGTRLFSDDSGDHPDAGDLFLKVRNPTWLYRPRVTQTFEAYRVEGRAGLAASVEREKLGHQAFGPRTFSGASVRWLATRDTRYLDPALWDGGGTVEGQIWLRSSEARGAWAMAGQISLGGGVEYRNRGPGLSTGDRYDAQPYFRGTAEATTKRSLGKSMGLALRGYAGWVESGESPLKQRRLFVAGADPYEQFSNPFLRSRGALLAGTDVHYQTPGGGGVRGLAAGTTSTRLLAVNAEVDRGVFRRSTTGLFNEVRVAGFGDVAVGNGDIPQDGLDPALVADLGVGLRIRHQIGQTSFVTRFDFPIFVTRPRLAVNAPDKPLGLRWVVSVQD